MSDNNYIVLVIALLYFVGFFVLVKKLFPMPKITIREIGVTIKNSNIIPLPLSKE